MTLTYVDFELEIGPPNGQSYPITLLRSPAGEARATLTWPFGELALENRLKDLQIALLSSGGVRRTFLNQAEEAVQRFGAELFDLLFTGEVRNRYDVSQERAGHTGLGLRIKLRIQSPQLANLPWEFLHDLRTGEYICLSRQTPLVRYLELPQTIRPLAVTPPLRILGMIAAPTDQQGLDVAVERQRLARAVAPLQDEGLVELHWLEGASWRALQRAMRREQWHIFHFVGHGDFDAQRDEGMVLFCDAAGRAQRFMASDLGRLLADHRTLRLTVLNACLGAQGSNRDLFSSTAATLVRRGIPAVVAMQQAITDGAAIEFTQTFYESLADGLPVDAAMSEARKAISFAVANTLEWGTPVLFSRAPDGELFDLTAAGETRDRETRDRETRDRETRDRETRDRETREDEIGRGDSGTVHTTRNTHLPSPQPGDQQTLTIAGVDFTFCYVPAGPFLMGSNDYHDDEKPQHTFATDAFWILRTPVTNAHFRPFAEGDGYRDQTLWTAAGWQWLTAQKYTAPRYWTDDKWNGAQQPVVGISWYEAMAYAGWLNKQTDRTIRLPGEAEWEKAARGTDGRLYPWGDEPPDASRCNFGNNVGGTTPVDRYPNGASPYGCLDMAGNVWEWTSTKWIDNYTDYADRVDNASDSDAPRVWRGGAFDDDVNRVRPAFRNWSNPHFRNVTLRAVRLVCCPHPLGDLSL